MSVKSARALERLTKRRDYVEWKLCWVRWFITVFTSLYILVSLVSMVVAYHYHAESLLWFSLVLFFVTAAASGFARRFLILPIEHDYEMLQRKINNLLSNRPIEEA